MEFCVKIVKRSGSSNRHLRVDTFLFLQLWHLLFCLGGFGKIVHQLTTMSPRTYSIRPRFTYGRIYWAFSAMVSCFLGNFGRRGLHSPKSNLKIINHPDSNLMFFSFIGRSLSHLRFKMNLHEKLRI